MLPLLSNYQMLPDNQAGLDQVLAQQKNGVQIMMVEMPVAPGYMDFFDNGYKDYENYINKVSEILVSSHVPLMRSQSDLSIPLDGWLDYNHLNNNGASLFSA